MKPIIHTALVSFAAVLVLTGTAATKPATEGLRVEHMAPRQVSSHDVPVALTAQPGSEADGLARQLMAHEIERVRARTANSRLYWSARPAWAMPTKPTCYSSRFSPPANADRQDAAPYRSGGRATGGSGLWIP
jgi:hypothetical protein